MNKMIVFIGILFLLAFAGGYYVNGITGNVVSEGQYSYTKAVCNGDQCLDVYVECSSNGMKITPITPYTKIDVSRFNITNEIVC